MCLNLNTEMSKQESKPKIKLPFEQKKEEPGEWAYDHRIGLFVVVIVYLAMGITFISAKLMVGQKNEIAGFIIDIEPEKELTPEEQRKLQERMASYDDMKDVKNLSSNENAKELNENLKDNRNPDAKKIYNEADEVQGKVRANREAYERGLREEREMIERAKGDKGEQQQQRTDSKVKGRVTVSFSFSNPVRNSQKLYIPAYRCQGGGEVTVNATLSRNGDVIGATVDKASSSSDRCLCEMAVEAALASRFNIESSAPERHKGTITYMFIPQ